VGCAVAWASWAAESGGGVSDGPFSLSLDSSFFVRVSSRLLIDRLSLVIRIYCCVVCLYTSILSLQT
jgi:hypothetical protein